jgi:geranylgeranyl reductase family protein
MDAFGSFLKLANLENIISDSISNGSAFFAFSGLITLCFVKKHNEKQKRRICNKTKTRTNEKKLDFDVLIVGAGPSGSTAAYFSAQKGLNVGLFDKKVFPRNKPCGDAWCAPALDILEEMGVLQKMEKDGITNPVKRGGLISPFGYECINTDGSAYGSVTGCKTYAIKREIADEYLVRAAAQKGANLHEGVEITNASFNAQENYWTVTTKATENEKTTNDKEQVHEYTCRMLLIGDGSTSYLAQKLGIIPQGSQSEAVCSTAYIKNNAWKDADGVMIFNKSVLPGYSALFRHYNGDMYLGTYILPGGKATGRAIAPFEAEALEKHPYIVNAVGKDYAWSKKRTVAPIRLGGVPRSYDHQVMIIGDAAGHVDPLTGEGIHTAMISGKIAASCLKEMFANRNFSLDACRAYELRCYDSFGYEFVYSSMAARIIYMCPLLLDAVTVVGKRRGQPFLDFFGEVMTGVKPKSHFVLQFDLLLDITAEIVRQFFIQKILRAKPLIPDDIGQEVIDQQAIKKQG